MTRTFQELVTVAAEGGQDARDLRRDDCLDATRAHAMRRRQSIRRRHDEGESGSNVVHMLAAAADDILRGVFQFAVQSAPSARAAASRVALCAMGGYGRSELSPFSDLDVCLLFDRKMDEHVQALNSFLIPFLWDTGFAVGYTLHSVEEAVELAQTDMTAFTSVMESRMVVGDSSVFARLKLNVREIQAKQAPVIVQHKLRDRFEGLDAAFRDLYNPEPNIKENAGGLRDLHTALWLLTLTFGANNLDEAAARGLITSEEQLNFVEALDFLWRVRNELHFNANRAEDRLTYANQKHVAQKFGYASDGRFNLGPLMGDYYTAASHLRRLLTIAARICNYETPGAPSSNTDSQPHWAIQDGLLYAGLGQEKWFAHNPARLMEVIWESARRKVDLSRHTERLIARNLHLVGEPFRSSDLVRRFFVAICNRPLQAGHALRQAASVGLLARYLPEFRAIQGIVRYRDFHTYPVDEHTIRAVEALAEIPQMEGAVGRSLREAIEHLSDPYILVMAILFHDFGKAAGEIHIEESTRLTRRICRRMGMPKEDEERIAFLVQHHSLMTQISQYRDTDDEDIVASFAETMKTEERLRALFVLSFADLYAVGPGVWTDWKGTLLMQLYLKAVKKLLGKTESVDEAFWESEKAEAAREQAGAGLRDHVTEHLKGMGQRYFVAFSPEQVARHLECVDEAQQSGLSVFASNHESTNMTEVVICTRDRQGLFAEIAGSFSSQLIDINSAALFTRSDGIVLDAFLVSDARRDRPLTRNQIAGIESVLRAVLLEGKDVQTLVEDARNRLFALLQPRVPVQTRIEFDNDSSRLHTVIDIETGDRTGLLYDLTRSMAQAGLDIATARIVTDARRVRDSFYVTRGKSKITDASEQNAIRDRLLNAVHPG